ncbi:MAG: DNA-processing protein DprA [Anaerolineae bacterium]
MSRYQEAAYWLAALNAKGLDRRAAKAVIHHWCIEGGRNLSTLFAQDASKVAAQCAIDDQQVARLLAAKGDVPAKKDLLQELSREDVGVVTHVDVAYPESLIQRLPKDWLPYFLFYHGDLSILTDPGLAIVGAKGPSPEAQDLTNALVKLLAQESYPIINGYSSGIGRRAMDATRRQGGTAAILLPMGIRRFDGCLDEMRDEIEESRLLILSPYLPDAAYTETFARAREVLIAALSEAIFVIAPDHGPREWAWLDRFQRRGGKVFIWNDDSDEINDWTQAGALLFQELADAEGLLCDIFGATPGGVDEKLEDDELVDMDPIDFIDADSAIEVLSQSGEVPDVLAKRLRDADWPEPQVRDDEL